MGSLLRICDDRAAFDAAQLAAKGQRAGCKGLAFGNKPHVLDAMEILDKLWSSESKYCHRDLIQRCWRKANCLPMAEQIGVENTVGHRDKNEITIDVSDLDSLCDAMIRLRATR